MYSIFCINAVFQIILYVLGIILLFVLIMLVLKAMKTLSKVDKVIEDVDQKSKKLNGVFDIIDNTTDVISSFSDKMVDLVVTKVQGLFNRKKKNKEEDENE